MWARIHPATSLALTVAVALATPVLHAQPCEWDWTEGLFAGQGTSDTVMALAVFDGDLYAGGGFRTAGGADADHVAKWDGFTWSSVGRGFNSWVYALTVFDDGTGEALYAAGDFTADGEGWDYYARTAKWDGTEWSPLGEGMDAGVNALAEFDGELYAGGFFSTAGGVTAYHIARWDGTQWFPVDGGLNGPVYALAVYDGALYVGGDFTEAGGVPASYIAKWDGQQWSPVNQGVDAPVDALGSYDLGGGDVLYVGGYFTSAGGEPASYLAQWDGNSWSEVGGGTNDAVFDLLGFGGELYVGGRFTEAGGAGANFIAKWNGTSWSPLDSGVDDSVEALAVYDDGSGAGEALYAGGWFPTAGPIGVNYIGKWDGDEWSALGGQGMNGPVHALIEFNGELYAGGDFTTAGGVSANHIAKWNGAEWSPLGDGTDATVCALAVLNGELYVGGYFQEAGGVQATSVAKWDGDSWSALGSGLGYPDNYYDGVSALAVYDDGGGEALYAGGSFWFTGDWAELHHIAKWDGVEWVGLGTGPGLNDYVHALIVFNDGGGDALYAGGRFSETYDGSVELNAIGKWDGIQWSDVGGGVSGEYPSDGEVRALTVFDDGTGEALYAGGYFHYAGGEPADNIAEWNGLFWSPLGPGLYPNTWPCVRGLTVFNEGEGDALYAGGGFRYTGDYQVELNGIGKWDAYSWSPLDAGVNSAVGALVGFDDGTGDALYVGGDFTAAGGYASTYIAKWACIPYCPGDLDGDDDTDHGDLGILLADWGCTGGDCPGDLDGDGDTDHGDLGILLADWGCGW